MSQTNSTQKQTSKALSSMSQRVSSKELLGYILIVIGILLVDQVSKQLAVYAIEQNDGKSIWLIDDLLRIVHVKNSALLFGIGSGMPAFWRFFLTIFVPIGLLCGLFVYLVFSHDFTKVQRNLVAIIIGGGSGNLFDRILRAEGVVDFIDVRIFGLFGMEWWPTFNFADTSIVVSGILFFILSVFTKPATVQHYQYDALEEKVSYEKDS